MQVGRLGIDANEAVGRQGVEGHGHVAEGVIVVVEWEAGDGLCRAEHIIVSSLRGHRPHFIGDRLQHLPPGGGKVAALQRVPQVGVLQDKLAGPTQFQAIYAEVSQARQVLLQVVFHRKDRVEEEPAPLQRPGNPFHAMRRHHVADRQQIGLDHNVGQGKEAAIAQKGERVVVLQEEPSVEGMDAFGQARQSPRASQMAVGRPAPGQVSLVAVRLPADQHDVDGSRARGVKRGQDLAGLGEGGRRHKAASEEAGLLGAHDQAQAQRRPV